MGQHFMTYCVVDVGTGRPLLPTGVGRTDNAEEHTRKYI